SCATTLLRLAFFVFTPVCVLLVVNSCRQLLPTARGQGTPWPPFGVYLKMPFTIRFQSRSNTTSVLPFLPRKITFVTISLGDISAMSEVYVASWRPVLPSFCS